MSLKSRVTFVVIKNNLKIGSVQVKSNRDFKIVDKIEDYDDNRKVKGIFKNLIKEDFEGLMSTKIKNIESNLKIVKEEN